LPDLTFQSLIAAPTPARSASVEEKLIRARLAPLYLAIVERTVAELSLADLDGIENKIDKLTKQRDEIVSQIYRTMRFLATVMILVFLLELKAVSFKGELWGMNLKADQSELIFGLLLIGNLIALLFATAMTKMFMLEFVLKSYFYLRDEGNSLFITGIAYRFYAFTFGLIGERSNNSLPSTITRPSRVIHALTIILLPLTYIFAYTAVLLLALQSFSQSPLNGPPVSLPPSVIHLLAPFAPLKDFLSPSLASNLIFGHRPQFWYFVLLCLFNLLTLSVYAFVFFPCKRPKLSKAQMPQLIAEKAYRLWDGAGRPEGRDDEIWLIAERQLKMMYNCT
jgi:hypothetical protein